MTQDTRTKLVHTAARLIWEKGFVGTGLKEILSQSQLPKGSLYHHFPGGKVELVTEALQYNATQMLHTYGKAMRGTKSPERGLAAIFDAVGQEMVNSDFRRGCPLATVALEVGPEQPGNQEALESYYHMWEDALTGYLERKSVREARETAINFLTLLEGGFILARSHRDIRFLLRLKATLPAIINY